MYATQDTTAEQLEAYKMNLEKIACYPTDLTQDVLIAITITNMRGKSIIIPIHLFGLIEGVDTKPVHCLAQCFKWFFNSGRHQFYVMDLPKYHKYFHQTFHWFSENNNHIGIGHMASAVHINIDHLPVVIDSNQTTIANMNASIHNPVEGCNW
ncbi:MAG: hypothetical protein GY739_13800, partial [Mesoflavibacter sp.]|nr:hypothetical protein [Mesoflavibacter sp.]